MSEYGVIFLIGFFSSLGHCIGMCGGFVTAYSLQWQKDRPLAATIVKKLHPHALYNSGRLLTYILLGAAFGMIGETLQIIGDIAPYQGGLQAFAGIVMILIGIDMSGILPSNRSLTLPVYNWFKKQLGGSFHKAREGKLFSLGFVMGFIPCGLVYAAGAKAAATGSVLEGMLTMAAFGLGTVPALFAVGLSASVVGIKTRTRLFQLATLLVIILGMVTVYRGYHNLTMALHQPEVTDLQCH
jgi:hypothetical protein